MNLENYSIIELKALLRHVNMKSSGTKAELIQRLMMVREDVMVQAVAAVVQGSDENPGDKDDDADDAEQLRDKVGHLCEIVSQLSGKVSALRSSVSKNPSPIMSANGIVSSASQSMMNSCVVTPQIYTTLTNTTPSVHGCITHDQLINVSQPMMMYPDLSPTTVAQTSFLPLPHVLNTQQHNVNTQQHNLNTQQHYSNAQQQCRYTHTRLQEVAS